MDRMDLSTDLSGKWAGSSFGYQLEWGTWELPRLNPVPRWIVDILILTIWASDPRFPSLRQGLRRADGAYIRGGYGAHVGDRAHSAF